MAIEAVILAGGKGKRLLPHTAEIPKPLVPVNDRPIISYLLETFRKAGVGKVYIAVNHMAHLIESTIGYGDQFGLEIHYAREHEPLSTVGPLKRIDNLPEHFIVANGDVITDLDIKALYEHHCANDALVTVASFARTENIDYGVLRTENDRLVGFEEKPDYSFQVSMGIYVFSREVLSLVPENEAFGFDQLMLKMLAENKPVAIYPHSGYWLDVGRPEDYERAQDEVAKYFQ